MRCAREVSTFGIAALCEAIAGRCWRSHSDWNVLVAVFAQQPVDQLGARFGIAEGGGNAENLQLRATQRQSNREGVVDIVADIGIDDDFLGGWFRGARLRRLCMSKDCKPGRKPDAEERDNER
jgi:hypothetical protein